MTIKSTQVKTTIKSYLTSIKGDAIPVKTLNMKGFPLFGVDFGKILKSCEQLSSTEINLYLDECNGWMISAKY